MVEAMPKKIGRNLPAVVYRFNLADLFDRAGRLRPLGELPPEIQAEIASFDIVRVTTRTDGERVITEELIRVKTRDRRTARVVRDCTSVSARRINQKPLQPRVVTVRERSAGAGRTSAALATEPTPIGKSSVRAAGRQNGPHAPR
jgi:hypothetical protein